MRDEAGRLAGCALRGAGLGPASRPIAHADTSARVDELRLIFFASSSVVFAALPITANDLFPGSAGGFGVGNTAGSALAAIFFGFLAYRE